MNTTRKRNYILSAALLAAFALWTMAVCTVDVRPVGPEGSCIGFAALNRSFHRLTGVHMTLYTLTDWLSLVPVGFGLGFAAFGLAQWIQRRRLRLVDRSILVLGGFYLVVMAAYVFFEIIIVNYRPILIGGIPEASYPSSTTMLVLCVIPTAMLQLKERIKSRRLSRCVTVVLAVFTGFMLIGRLLSGVHWLSDIIGGVLLSAGLVLLYAAICE